MHKLDISYEEAFITIPVIIIMIIIIRVFQSSIDLDLYVHNFFWDPILKRQTMPSLITMEKTKDALLYIF